MGKRKSWRAERPLPGGIDPSEFVDSTEQRRRDRKTGQLCREVREALSIALATLDDEALDGAWVADVLPGLDHAHVRVIVMAARDADVDQTLDALRRASGLLRTEVAHSLARKRTPLLSFEVHKEVEP